MRERWEKTVESNRRLLKFDDDDMEGVIRPAFCSVTQVRHQRYSRRAVSGRFTREVGPAGGMHCSDVIGCFRVYVLLWWVWKVE